MATKIDFSTLNLEPMDFNAYSHTEPDIFINRSSVTFSRSVLEILCFPQYVQYLIDPKNRVFALRSCKGNEPKAKPFSKPKAEQTATISCSVKAFHTALIRLIPDYAEGKRYKVRGVTNGNEKIVYFFMKDAEVKEFHTKDKE